MRRSRRLLAVLGAAVPWMAALCSVPLRAQMPAPATATATAFMQGMILHHAQALEMSALMQGRTTDRQMLLLGERIAVSQRDEIALMSEWLRERGMPVPDVALGTTHHGHQAHGEMPGMASPADMADLATRRGWAFDRRFLTLMIRHHEGALVMVAGVLGTTGGADDGELFRFASDVDADQRAEIRRMQALLASMTSSQATPRRRS